MKGSRDILASVVKTAQMGQTGIRSVMKSPIHMNLKSALRTQLDAYGKIERDALLLASERGWEIKQLRPEVKAMTDMMTRMRLSVGNTTSKAAAMMIQGNTRGIIKGYKNQNQYPVSDERVLILSQRLLECEKAGCRQMQGFL